LRADSGAWIVTTNEPRSAFDREGIFPDGTVVKGGHLVVGGCDLVGLARTHGTPLYVFDEATIRARARGYLSAIAHGYPGPSSVCYAAKAYCAPWLLRLLAEEGLGLDVVSGGELYAALLIDFPRDRIYLHGNNKGRDELEFALASGVGRIVLDNLDEIRLLGRLAEQCGVRQPVLLRVGPGIESDAHVHLRTGGTDSKFGLAIGSGLAEAGVRAVLAEPSLDLRGLHMHVGSQISDVEVYRIAIDRIFEFASAMGRRHGLELQEISPGGGFGVRYTPDADPVDACDMVRRVAEFVTMAARAHGMGDPAPYLTIEPGRSMVASAAVALYRVGSVKAIPGGRTYVSVDGGMADNVRPAAYGAEYTALTADRMNDASSCEVSIAGKYCESGDVLIHRVRLPEPRIGDLVAIPAAGAYQLSMASNYNMAPRPAVAVVSDGADRLVRRRETYADLLARDLAVVGDELPPTFLMDRTGSV
jgi:diaminopimelate decarboxylase